jgi:hypothetical protein
LAILAISVAWSNAISATWDPSSGTKICSYIENS